MRDVSEDLALYLLESCSYRLHADVFYGDERTFEDLPVVDWQLDWDLSQNIPADGSLTIAYQGDGGDSLSPRDFLDKLAPFGQEVNVLLEVTFGDLFTETVLLGRYRITKAPKVSDDWFGFDGRPYVLDSMIELTIQDLLTIPAAWSFRGPSVPKRTTSSWAEVQRISGLPIAPSLVDQPTPGKLVYSPAAGGRLLAVQQLLSRLGGMAVTNEYGELTAIPYTAGDAVLTLEMGTRGQIIAVEDALTVENVFNEVCGEYQDADGNPIYAWATVSSGPLAADGELRTRTAPTDNDDTITTIAAARTRVQPVLRQYLSALTIRRTLTCVFDPRAQLGDVVDVNGPRTRKADRTLSDPAWTSQSARIVEIHAGQSSSGQMTVVLEEGAAVKASIRVGP
jgi:hypothetical protein